MSGEHGSLPVASLAQSDAILASHSLLLALPAFVPALLVVIVVVVIAMRDRRGGDDPPDEDDAPFTDLD
ncbi:MAG: hypothetical protein ICV72_07620 [Aldersonia sp.]|nr:hypothetical protein [Aldersonia sp.]